MEYFFKGDTMRTLFFLLMAMVLLLGGCANTHQYLEETYRRHQLNSAMKECSGGDYEMCRQISRLYKECSGGNYEMCRQISMYYGAAEQQMYWKKDLAEMLGLPLFSSYNSGGTL